MKFRLSHYLLVIAVCSCLTGCATGFKRSWKHFEDPTPADPFTGKWEGTWLSKSNGHNGGLRAIIVHREADVYDARFHATYARVLQFTHGNPFQITRDGDNVAFSGESDLGKLAGGVYRYEGTVVGDHFDSTYEAKVDHGVFSMERVTGE